MLSSNKQTKIHIYAVGLTLYLAFINASIASDHQSGSYDLDAGGVIYQSTCRACHGPKAQGNAALNSPALAGQLQNYLIRQLTHFKQGIRGGSKEDAPSDQMAMISQNLTDISSIQNVSAYLASLPKPKASINALKTAGGNNVGYKYYQASCGACHGGIIEGNERLNSPSLAGLSDDYLNRQYQNFLSGRRGSHKLDRFGRQMKIISNTLSEPDKIKAVINYITSLND